MPAAAHPARSARWLEDARTDVRFAVRTLRARPGFTAAAVLTLAVGVGATGAIFSAVDAVLLRPLPYAEPAQLVRIWSEGSYPAGAVEVLRERTQVYTQIEGYRTVAPRTFTDERGPERLPGVQVTSGLFALLGVRPLLGRTLEPGDERPGAEPVIVLSARLWSKRFGSDRGIVGRSVHVDGVARTIVGVMPTSFRFLDGDIEYWLPVPFNSANPGQYWGSNFSYTIGRLRPQATLAHAQNELDALVPVVRAAFPWRMGTDWGNGAVVAPLRDTFAGSLRNPLVVLLGAAGFLLLIACLNVANLLLVQAQARQAEVAIRTALGAGRARVVRQLLVENLVLALIGGAAGMVLAWVTVNRVIPLLAAELFRAHDVRVDARMIGFALLITVLTALLFGVAPALRTARVAETLRGRRGSAGTSQRPITGALVTAEIALAMVLVTGAGLLVKSFARILAVDPGFRHQNIITATIAPPAHRFPDDASRRALLDDIEHRVRMLPGVRSVAFANGVPFGPGVYGSVFVIEGRPNPAIEGGAWPWADARLEVTPDFHATLGVPLIAGRGFTDADIAGAQPVAIVSEQLARNYWPDDSPIGKRITFPGADNSMRTIVGVTRDVILRSQQDDPGAALYLPLAQREITTAQIVVHTAGDARSISANLRAIVSAADRDTPVSDIHTMAALLAAARGSARTTLVLLAVFAATSLFLGVLGVYGLGAYAVSQRRREIGIRMALGATGRSVASLVLKQGATHAIIGVTAGILAAIGLTRFLSSLLFGVSPYDAKVFASVALVLAGSALLASLLPARRAARVNPTEALRGD